MKNHQDLSILSSTMAQLMSLGELDSDIGRSYLEVLGKNWKRILLRDNTEMISLNQHNGQIYHQQNRVWLQLKFHSYTTEQGEKLTLFRICEYSRIKVEMHSQK